jgi:CubicO group peptidase (beta-lactamase class C family)
VRSIGCAWRVAVVLVSALTARGGAQESPHRTAADPRDLESFSDGYFQEQMPRQHVPGAVLVLVKDGRTLLAKGYGFADLEKRVPVTPERTVFRVASVSKLFTATAVMQLVEGGRLGLDDDVNAHLRRFKLPSNYVEPVTIAHLLTHRGGFDEQLIGMAAPDPAHSLPLGEYLSRRMPPAVMPPGRFISYSNHGFALLGHIIEEVSGRPFADYMEEYVLRPLGMAMSSFHQPLPGALAGSLAVGYLDEGGTLEPLAPDVLQTAPAGSLVTTGTDVARFMVAHLHKGRLDGGRILQEDTAEMMQRRQFSHDSRMPGLGYGFWERPRNRHRAIVHDGGWGGFYSLMWLLPEEDVGVFIAANRFTFPPSSDFGDEYIKRFVDRYYPAAEGRVTAPQERVLPTPTAEVRRRGARVAGVYRSLRIPPQHTFEKGIGLFLQFRVALEDDGTLTLQSPFGEGTRWAEVEPFVFRDIGGEDHIAFRGDAGGRMKYLLQSGSVFERLPWYDDAAVQVPALAAMALLFVVTPAGWLLGALVGSLRRRPRARSELRRARVLAGAVCVLNACFLLGLGALLADYPNAVLHGVPAAVVALFVVPLAGAAGAAGAVAFAARAWLWKQGGFLARVHYTLVATAAVVFVAFLYHWNLLGLRF